MTAITERRVSTGVRFGQWFVRTHFPVDVIMGAAAISLALIRWGSMPDWQQLGYGVFIVLCIHQLEEYRFPGGFVWGQNMTIGSPSPANYPGNSLSATIVDVTSTIAFGVLLFFWPTRILAAFLVVFATVEVIVHLAFGINAYLRYRGVGKTTIYFPGNLTAFLGFGPLVLTGYWKILSQHVLGGGQWWLVAMWFVIFMLVDFVLPIGLTTRRNSPFVYPSVPEEGYYLHKYEVLLQKQRAVKG